jgi:hypothetical protein
VSGEGGSEAVREWCSIIFTLEHWSKIGCNHYRIRTVCYGILQADGFKVLVRPSYMLPFIKLPCPLDDTFLLAGPFMMNHCFIQSRGNVITYYITS